MSTDLIITEEFIMSKILLIRNQKVMIDRDLAELYGVTTGNLNKSVKRNLFSRGFYVSTNQRRI